MAAKRPDRAWIGAGAAASVTIIAAGWFFFLSPQLDAKAESEQQLADAQTQNIVLQQRLTTLRNEAEHTADIQAELSSARAAVPADHDIAGFTRQLTEQAAAAGVALTSITPGEPVELVIEAPSAPPAPAEDADASSDNSAEEATDAATAPVADGPAGKLFTVQVTVQTDGPLAAQRAFLSALERDGVRRPLVTNTSLQPSAEATPDDDEVEVADEASKKKKARADVGEQAAPEPAWSMTTQMQIFVAPQATIDDVDASSNSN